jgi:hypothetical protein
MNTITAPIQSRKIGFMLGLGVFVLPYFFVWFLLRKGYSPLARIVGFGWLGLIVLAAASPRTPTNFPSSGTHTVETPAAPAPHRAVDDLVLKNFTWHLGGFNVVALADFTISNKGTAPVSDIKIECTTNGKSGTDLSHAKQTIYDTIPAGATKTFREVNLGFVNNQSNGLRCDIGGAR